MTVLEAVRTSAAEAMQAFAPLRGRWTFNGFGEGGRGEGPCEVVGGCTYEWMEGGLFLQQRSETTFIRGEDCSTHTSLQIFGFDEVSGMYRAHLFPGGGLLGGQARMLEGRASDLVVELTGVTRQAISFEEGGSVTWKWSLPRAVWRVATLDAPGTSAGRLAPERLEANHAHPGNPRVLPANRTDDVSRRMLRDVR